MLRINRLTKEEIYFRTKFRDLQANEMNFQAECDKMKKKDNEVFFLAKAKNTAEVEK